MASSILTSRLRTSTPLLHHRALSTTTPKPASVLFALHALSNSRETQHLNRISQLPRPQHSPPLQLIQTSEVDPFRPRSIPPPTVPLRVPASSSTPPWDAKALALGRAVLADHAQQTGRLQRALQRSKRREARLQSILAIDRAGWEREAGRMRNEMRGAGVLILVAVGTATAVASWRFGPQRSNIPEVEVGSKIASRVREAIPLPVSASVGGSSAVAASSPAAAAAAESTASTAGVGLVVEAPAVVPATAATTASGEATGRWWRGLFWKQG